VRTVRARLTALFVALTGGMLAIFFLALYLWHSEQCDREIDHALRTQSSMFTGYFFVEYDDFIRGLSPDLRPPVEAYTRAGGLVAEVRRGDGTVLFASPGFAPEVRGSSVRATVAGVPYRGKVVPAETPKGEKLVLTVAVSEAARHRALRQLLTYFAVFYPVVLVLAGLLGYLFVGQALAPVEEIRRQAERISRENLSERVPEPRPLGEFRNLARTFNEMLDRLDRAFQDLQNFAADAAHELRTPLANLRAEVETAIQQERTPEEYERILASLAEEIGRMSRIVTDLFTLAKLDMRQYALQKERIRLRPLLDEARETWQPSAEGRGIAIRAQGEDARVAGDPVALRRVFMNLVENAVKYNRDGGTVTLSVERVNGKVRVKIADTGMGIPADHLPRLFRRFYRVDKARSRDSGGAGLGLAICKSFVEAHEGRIEVTSSPGEGTTFTVELPVTE
jgi:heavy metal sensor kinase